MKKIEIERDRDRDEVNEYKRRQKSVSINFICRSFFTHYRPHTRVLLSHWTSQQSSSACSNIRKHSLFYIFWRLFSWEKIYDSALEWKHKFFCQFMITKFSVGIFLRNFQLWWLYNIFSNYSLFSNWSNSMFKNYFELDPNSFLSKTKKNLTDAFQMFAIN